MPDDNHSKVVNRLLYLKTEKERELGRTLTLAEIAEGAGVDVMTISRWMKGKSPAYDVERKIALFFGKDIGDLLTIQRNDAPAPLPEDEGE